MKLCLMAEQPEAFTLTSWVGAWGLGVLVLQMGSWGLLALLGVEVHHLFRRFLGGVFLLLGSSLFVGLNYAWGIDAGWVGRKAGWFAFALDEHLYEDGWLASASEWSWFQPLLQAVLCACSILGLLVAIDWLPFRAIFGAGLPRRRRDDESPWEPASAEDEFRDPVEAEFPSRSPVLRTPRIVPHERVRPAARTSGRGEPRTESRTSSAESPSESRTERPKERAGDLSSASSGMAAEMYLRNLRENDDRGFRGDPVVEPAQSSSDWLGFTTASAAPLAAAAPVESVESVSASDAASAAGSGVVHLARSGDDKSADEDDKDDELEGEKETEDDTGDDDEAEDASDADETQDDEDWEDEKDEDWDDEEEEDDEEEDDDAEEDDADWEEDEEEEEDDDEELRASGQSPDLSGLPQPRLVSVLAEAQEPVEEQVEVAATSPDLQQPRGLASPEEEVLTHSRVAAEVVKVDAEVGIDLSIETEAAATVEDLEARFRQAIEERLMQNVGAAERELLWKAVEVISDLRSISLAELQRFLNLTYYKAARVFQQLEKAGLISGYTGELAREVLRPQPSRS